MWDSIAWNHKYTCFSLHVHGLTVMDLMVSVVQRPNFSISKFNMVGVCVCMCALSCSNFPSTFKMWYISTCSDLFLVYWFIHTVWTKNGHTLLDMLTYFFAIDWESINYTLEPKCFGVTEVRHRHIVDKSNRIECVDGKTFNRTVNYIKDGFTDAVIRFPLKMVYVNTRFRRSQYHFIGQCFTMFCMQ